MGKSIKYTAASMQRKQASFVTMQRRALIAKANKPGAIQRNAYVIAISALALVYMAAMSPIVFAVLH